MIVPEQYPRNPAALNNCSQTTLDEAAWTAQSVPLMIVWGVVKRPTTAPQAFPVTGVVGLDGAVGVVGVELEPPPPHAGAVMTASAKMATAAHAEAVRTNIRKRAFLPDHQG
jgi:hypothetical protein